MQWTAQNINMTIRKYVTIRNRKTKKNQIFHFEEKMLLWKEHEQGSSNDDHHIETNDHWKIITLFNNKPPTVTENKFWIFVV